MGLLKTILAGVIIVSPVLCRADSDDITYRRNSLYSIMIAHPEYKFADELESVYRDVPMPERFNDHNLGVRVVRFGASNRQDQTENIEEFIAKVNLPQKMVSRWFNRKKQTGAFDMDLVRERGAYNANLGDIEMAKVAKRGIALLEDAGEELIPNTYVIFNDIIYNSKSGIGSIMKMYGSALVGGVDQLQSSMQEIGGFKVTVRTYLYQLVWNDSIATTFYKNFYFEDDDATKSNAYLQEHDLFKLQYVGMTESSGSQTSFVGVKDPAKLLRKVLGRVLDENISDLMKKYPDFRIKSPLISTEPLRADVGLKEGITNDSRFEVLMPEYDEKGRLKYNRVGTVRPKEGKIKDNRYLAGDDEEDFDDLEATEFEVVSGKEFVVGMLLREI